MITRDVIKLVIRDDVQQIGALLKNGNLSLSDADADGRTLLHAAVSTEALSLTKMLLSLGADVHAKNKYGMGPLSDAARIGNIAALSPLVQAGADPNEQDVNGFTPMHHAMLCEEPGVRNMLRALIQLGADAERANDFETELTGY